MTEKKTTTKPKAKPTQKAVTKEEKPKAIVMVSPSDFLDFPRTAEDQHKLIAMPTPKRHIKQRKGVGNMTFDYVTLNYVVGRLNAITIFDWDFEVVSYEILKEQMMIALQGRLTLRLLEGKVITKTAFGGSNIKTLQSDRKKMVDFANDLKSAEADCIKKCASLAGICWDVYAGYSEFEMPETVIEQPKEVDEEKGVHEGAVVDDTEDEAPPAMGKTAAQVAKDKLEEQIEKDIRNHGEYQVTDALQMMIDRGASFSPFEIDEWFDCGIFYIANGFYGFLSDSRVLIGKYSNQCIHGFAV